MNPDTIQYLSSAFILSIGAFLGWLLRFFIQKKDKVATEEKKAIATELKRIFDAITIIQKSNTEIAKDVGFLKGRDAEHSYRLEKHGNKLMEHAEVLAEIKTELKAHLRTK